MKESQIIEYKSIQKIRMGDKGFAALSVTCVAFANSQGGQIFIGYDDKTKKPEEGITIEQDEINGTAEKLRSRCFNVALAVSQILTAQNGSQFFIINVSPSLKSIASTSDGKFYMRVADKCVPIHSEDIQRLANEKQAFQWELVYTKHAKLADVPTEKVSSFCSSIRKSDRVSEHIKQFTDYELLENYNLVDGEWLTNLGVLWLGSASQRSKICYPITVQYIVYDNFDKKVRKLDWHDNLFNPSELLLDIEKQAIELTYSYEFPNGLFRKQVRHYHPKVIRELLLNAFAHKSFTISGDIMIEVYPDRLEITNPGSLPLGVTKDNILHQRQRRNPQFIRIMHDMGLMEGEGSGFDLIYELNVKDAKRLPIVETDFNQTKIIQYAEVTNPELVALLDFVDNNYQLSQKNMIALGLVAQSQKLLSTELTKLLQLPETERMRSYTDNLVEENILITRGVKKGNTFLVNPKLIANAKVNRKTSLKTMEPYRLKALIEEDLKHHPGSKMSDIISRLPDADAKDIRKAVYQMVDAEVVCPLGENKNRTYILETLSGKKKINKK